MGVIPGVGAVRVLEVFLNIRDTGMVSKLNRVNRQVGMMQAGFVGSAKSIRTFQTQAAVSFFAISAGVGAVTRHFAEFQNQVQLAAFAGNKSFAEMSAMSKQLSRDFATSAITTAEVAKEVQQLGDLSKEAALAFAETGIQFELSTGRQTKAADAASTVFRLLKIESERTGVSMDRLALSSERVGSAIVIAGDKSAAGITQLEQFLERLQNIGIAANFTTAEIIALGGALSSLEPSQGRTFSSAITRLFSKGFVNPRSAGAIRRFIEEQGVLRNVVGKEFSAAEFNQLRTNEPGTLLVALAQALASMGPEGGAAKAVELGITNVRDVRLVNALRVGAELYVETLKEVNAELYGSDKTLLSERTRILLLQLKGAWDGFTASIGRLADTIGSVLSPVLVPLLKTAEGLVNVFAENKFLAAAAGIGLLGAGISSIAFAGRNIKAMGGGRFFGIGSMFRPGGGGGFFGGGGVAPGMSFGGGPRSAVGGGGLGVDPFEAAVLASFLPNMPLGLPAGRISKRRRLGVGSLLPGIISMGAGRNPMAGRRFIHPSNRARRLSPSDILKRKPNAMTEALLLNAQAGTLTPDELAALAGAGHIFAPTVSRREVLRSGTRRTGPFGPLVRTAGKTRFDTGTLLGLDARRRSRYATVRHRATPPFLNEAELLALSFLTSRTPQGAVGRSGGFFRRMFRSRRTPRLGAGHIPGLLGAGPMSDQFIMRSSFPGVSGETLRGRANKGMVPFGGAGVHAFPTSISRLIPPMPQSRLGQVGGAAGRGLGALGAYLPFLAMDLMLFPGVGAAMRKRFKGATAVTRGGLTTGRPATAMFQGMRRGAGAGMRGAAGFVRHPIQGTMAGARAFGAAALARSPLDTALGRSVTAQAGRRTVFNAAGRQGAALIGTGARGGLIRRGASMLGVATRGGRGAIGQGVLGGVGRGMAARGIGGMAARGGMAALGLAGGPVGLVVTALSVLTPMFRTLGNTLDDLGQKGGIIGFIAKRLATLFKVLELLGNVVNFVFKAIFGVIKKVWDFITNIPGVKQAIGIGNKAFDKLNEGLDTMNDKLSGREGSRSTPPALPAGSTFNVAVGDPEQFRRIVDDSRQSVAGSGNLATTTTPRTTGVG